MIKHDAIDKAAKDTYKKAKGKDVVSDKHKFGRSHGANARRQIYARCCVCYVYLCAGKGSRKGKVQKHNFDKKSQYGHSKGWSKTHYRNSW